MSKCKREIKRKPLNCLLAEWKRNPSLFDKDKLCLVGLNIHIIDAVPAILAASVRVLYLSENSICRLVGVEQFSNTVTLSVKNNGIRYLDEIRPLSLLRRLNKLSMEGNPVTRLPYYREHVIVSCPSLTILDDKSVSSEERSSATREFYRNTAYYDQLRINELRNCVILHIRNLIACHLELQQNVFGRFSHFLGEHIGQQSRCLNTISSSQCVTAGLGKVLQQALVGGVFCWLQRMDIKHFNHLVQDTLLQLLAHSIQQGKLGGASSKTDLWGTLLESYLKEQCSVFMEASEQCAVLRRMGGGSRGGMGQRDQPQMQHEQHQQEREWGEHMEALEEAQEYDAIMCCVDRVQFLSTPCTFSCTCCCPPPSTTTAATTAATAGRQKGSSSAGSGSGSGGSTSRDLMGRPSAASALLLPPVPCVAADPRVQHKQRDAGVHSRQHQPQHQPQHQHQHQHQHQMMSRPESPPPPPPPLLTSPALPSVRSLQPQPPPPPAHGDSRGKMCSAGGAIFEELPQRSPTVVHAPLDMSNGVLRQSPGDCESSWAAEQQIIQRTRERNSARYDQLLRTTLHKPSTVTLVPASSSGPAAAHPIRLTSNNISGSVPTLSSPAFSNSAPACGASLPAPAAGRRLALNSKLLPPQQEDPEPANVDHTQQSSSAPTVCRTGVNVDTSLDRTVAAARRDLPQQYEEQEQDRQSSLVAAAESAQFQSEVNDFLRRSLQSELALAVVAAEGIAEGEVREKGGADQLEAEERDGKEEEDPLLDLAFSQEMESRWLLSAQSISAYLTSSDQARDITDSREQRAEGSHLATTAIPAAAAAEGSSIAALKAQITCQNNKYLLSQRTEYALYGLHRALWDAVETFGEQSLALAKTAESHFSVRRKEIESVRQDASFGFTCLKGHRTALNNAQGARDRIRELLAEQAVLRAAEQESQQALTVARARREALATNIGQVKSAVAGLQSDAAVIFLIRHEQMSNRARAFWLASKACFSLRFRVFHELRKWVREQVKVRQFCTSQQQKNCVRVRGLAFAVWKRFIAVLKRGRQLQMWRGRTLRGSLFRRWRAEFVREARQLPAAVATFRSKALSRAFAAFQEASRVRRVAACEGKRLHMYAALFTSVRIFRAWKRLAQSSHREDVRLVGAFRHKAQVRVLRAWAAGATKRRAVLQEYSLIVVSRTTHLFFRRCLHVWRSLYSFRIHLSTTRKLKRSFRRFRSCVVNKRRQRATVLMAGVVAASGEGLLRGALVRCVRLWKARAGRRRRCKSAALRVASFRRAGVLREVWGTWRALSQRFRSLSRHMVLVARRSQWYLQCRAFSQWWSLMPKMPNSEFVSSQTKVQNIRQKWLNLFDDSAPVTAAAAAAGALAGQQHHRPAQLRPNDRQHGQALRVNRFKSSMSTVDFQLLYLDDDDEDEDENNERNGNGDEDREEGGLTGAFHAVVTSPHADAVGASSVFARRYLSRWAQCCARRASLRHRHGRVQVIAAETVCRRTFMVMRAALTARLLSLKDHYRAQLEAPVEMLQLGQSEMLAKRARMEDSEAVEQVKRGDLQQLSDSLSLALTASRVEMEAQQQVLADLDCSVCALGTERSSLLGRIAAAKAYIAGVRQQRDQYLNRGEKDADSRGSFSASDWGGAGGGKALHQAATSFLPGTLPDLLARLSAAATASNNDNDDAVSAGGRFRGGGSLGDGQRDDYSVSLTVQSDSSNADERMLLMQDVETLYREAVAAHEQMLRRKQHLANRREAASTLLEQRKEQERQLDAQTAALLEERAGAEEALRRCTDTLQDAFHKVNEQTQYHDEVLNALQQEERELRVRLQELAEQEQRLVARVEALQDHYQQEDLHSASHHQHQQFAPLNIAQREARAAQHLSISVSGVAGVRGISNTTTVSASNSTSGHSSETTKHTVHRSLSNTNVGAGAAIANAGAGRSMLRRGDQTQALTQAQAHQAADGNLVKPPLPQPQQQRKKNKVAGQEKGLRIGGKENDLSSSVVPSPAQSTKAATVVYGSASAAESAPRSIGSNGDYIGREIDALSLRIRQRLAAI